MEEVWKALDYLFLPDYEVSTFGRVRNTKTKTEMKGSLSKCGYNIIGFRILKKRVNHYVHRLVAHSFINFNGIENPSYEYIKSEKVTVDHIDRNRTNNNVNNLRWATRNEQRANQTLDRKQLKCKKVLQYDYDGKLLKTWNSVMEASLNTSFDESSIRYCCRGDRLTSNGYVWKYVDDKLFCDEEVWKKICVEGYGELSVSSSGKIRTVSGNIISGHSNGGYMVITLRNSNSKKMWTKSAHRLVAQAFIGNPDGFVVNHKNGNKVDNRVENLEIVTQKENVKHAHDTGLTDMTKQYKSVVRMDAITGEINGRYASIKQASIENGVHHGNITAVCKGRRPICGGYKWAYAEI